MSALNTGDKLFIGGSALGAGVVGAGIGGYLSGAFNWASFGMTTFTIAAGFLIGGWIVGALANQWLDKNAGGWAGVFVGFAALIGALSGSVGGYFVADEYVVPFVTEVFDEMAEITPEDLIWPRGQALPLNLSV